MCSNLKNIAVLVSGGGTNLQALIDAIKAGTINGKIKLVVSNRKAALGLERARLSGIEAVYIPGHNKTQEEFDRELISLLEDKQIDLIVLAGYLKILTPMLIEKYENKIINIHPSLIPSFCGEGFYGLKVHEAVIASGVKISGATTHFVSEIADDGPIIMQESVPVYFEDTAEKLQGRILEIEHKILVETVKLFCEDRLKVFDKRVKVG